MWRRFTKALLLILALGAAPALAKPVQLGVEAMRQLAFEAMQAGYAEDALQLAEALLQRDAGDATALMVKSQALRALGDPRAAQAAARKAWRAAETDNGRFAAAMALAQALSTEGRRTAAQLWLRRAADVAPSDQAYAMARRDFGYVQSRNPWVFNFDAQAAPSSNVNNGSSNRYMTVDGVTLGGFPILFDIPPEAQALSGVNFGFAGSATYRLSPTGPNRQTELTFGLTAQEVAFSADAKAAAPGIRAQDFSYQALELGITHNRGVGPEARNVLRLAAKAGHNWYGGFDLSNYLRLSVGLDKPLSETSTISFGLSADHTARLDRPIQSSDRIAASLGYSLALGPDRLSLEVEAADTASQSPELRNRALRLSMGWKKAEAVAGVHLSGGIELARQVFADSRYVAGGREDLKAAVSVQMSFDKLQYMGFSPVLTLRGEKNRSNTAQNARQSLGLSLSIQSAF